MIVKSALDLGRFDLGQRKVNMYKNILCIKIY